MCLPDAPTADPPVDARRTPGPVEVGQAKFSLEHLDPMAASGAGECPARTSVCAVDRAACPRAAHLAADSARGSRTCVYCSGAAPVAWGPADLRPWPADLHAFERIRVPRVEPRPRPRIFALVRGPAPLSRGPATLPMEPYARLGTLTLTPAEPLPCLWSRTLASGFASLCPLRGALACLPCFRLLGRASVCCAAPPPAARSDCCAVLPRAVRCCRVLCGASVCCAVRPSAVPCVRLLCRASVCCAVRPPAMPCVRSLRRASACCATPSPSEPPCLPAAPHAQSANLVIHTLSGHFVDGPQHLSAGDPRSCDRSMTMKDIVLRPLSRHSRSSRSRRRTDRDASTLAVSIPVSAPAGLIVGPKRRDAVFHVEHCVVRIWTQFSARRRGWPAPRAPHRSSRDRSPMR